MWRLATWSITCVWYSLNPNPKLVCASDNVATRYLVNDACVILRKPLVYGSALRMEGQLTVFNYKVP